MQAAQKRINQALKDQRMHIARLSKAMIQQQELSLYLMATNSPELAGSMEDISQKLGQEVDRLVIGYKQALKKPTDQSGLDKRL